MLFQLYSVALQHLVFILYPSHTPGVGEAPQGSPSTTVTSTLPGWLSHTNTGTEGSKDQQVHGQRQRCGTGDQEETGEGNQWTSLLNIVFYNLQQSLE